MTENVRKAALHVAPPLWGLGFLLAAAVANALYPWRTLFDLTSIPLAVLCVAGGVAIAFWARSLFLKHGATLIPDDPVNKALVEVGPYRWSRNPMYLSLVLIAIGMALFIGTLPFFVVPLAQFALVNFLFVPFEEEKMLRQFGETYAHYMRRVRRWI